MTGLHGITYKRLKGHPERVEEFRKDGRYVELIPSEVRPGWWHVVDYTAGGPDGFSEEVYGQRAFAIHRIERLLTTTH